MIINYGDECWHLNTEHIINDEIRQIFEDLVNRSFTHWTDGNIENFLSTKGNIAYGSITKMLSAINDPVKMTTILEKRIIKKIKKIIVCVYGLSITPNDTVKMLKDIESSIPEAEILIGHITDEIKNPDCFTIKMIAIYNKKTAKKRWSENLRNKTYIEIADMLTCDDRDDPKGSPYWVIGTSLLRFACLKHIDGTFGKMTVENALENRLSPPEKRRYIIECEGGAVQTFLTVDELIDAGWVLD
jgi:hypothetical protein